MQIKTQIGLFELFDFCSEDSCWVWLCWIVFNPSLLIMFCCTKYSSTALYLVSCKGNASSIWPLQPWDIYVVTSYSFSIITIVSEKFIKMVKIVFKRNEYLHLRTQLAIETHWDSNLQFFSIYCNFWYKEQTRVNIDHAITHNWGRLPLLLKFLQNTNSTVNSKRKST